MRHFRLDNRYVRIVIVALLVGLRRRARADEVLPPIVVTAPREAPSPDEPQAVTTIDGGDLESHGIEGTRDLSALAPNLFVSQDGDRKSAFVGIRGLSNASMGDSSVGLYVDDVPYVDQRGALIDLYDVDRVDVLRGPQTTTFGRNAEAGAISVYTPTPGNDVRARAAVRYGDYDEQSYQVSASGPLVTDRAFIGVAGLKSSRDGYVRNTFLHEDLDGRDLLGGRARLVLLPLPGLEVALSGEGQHADDGAQPYVLLDQRDPFKVAYDTPGSSKLDATVGALHVRYETPAAVLTSVTARRDFDSHDNELDLDLTPAPVAILHDDHRFTDWTQEIRVTSAPATDRWRWHLGAFFEDKTTEPDLTLLLPTAVPSVGNRQAAHYDARTWAGFGQATLTLLPGLDLTGGLRVEHFRVAMRREHTVALAGQPPMPAAPTLHLQQDSLAWLPHARLVWAPARSLSTYASAARGYRTGGFAHLTDDPVASRFKPSFGWTYELGARTAWLDGRLAAGLTLYWARVRDYQNVERVGLVDFAIRNARRVTSRGIEAEISASPLPGLDVTLGGGVIDAHYDHFCDPGSGHCFDGNRVMLAPDYDFHAAIAYRHPTGFVANVACQGIGEYPFLEDNLRHQAPYQLASARVGWEWRYFGVYAYGRNLADQTYFPFAIAPSGPTGYISNPGDPRTVGVMVVAHY